ncbi:MAG: protein kinase [Ktedonobacteraceae bacterium]|nr:protein kinase [Ktedonobacteraceae bacterium]
MLHKGEVVGRRYRIIQLVGKGGFGAVYEALDERFQSRRVVAIKEMGDAGLSTPERLKALQDFRHEADLLVELSHPNLPHVSDFFEESDKAYLVMEFVQGKTLAKLQEETGGPLDEHIVMEWALQLCDVLHYLHTQPQAIIFRDLKPVNVMLTHVGQIKLIDFGIARIFKLASHKDTNALGSRGYAPMEQYGQGQSDARTDIYALGATLYDLLTATIPPDAPSRFIHPQAFQRPRQLNPRIAESTERIILKAMEQSPQDRFQTIADMRQAIINSSPASQAKAAPAAQPPTQPVNKKGSIPPLPLVNQPQSRRRLPPFLLLASLLILVVLLVAIVPTILMRIHFPPTPGPNASPGPGSVGANGIGVYSINGEDIGISDGSYALDTKSDRAGRELKRQASANFRARNVSVAQSLWRADLQLDTNDAESLIYLEDQRVLASGQPYITLVVGVLLGTHTFDAYSRDYLQAAYVAQKECNDGLKLPGGIKVRLLIAKSGSDPQRSADIAQQIVKAAQFDKTLVGVMGWTTSATSVDTVPILARAHIPMVAAGVASDQLTGISPYFYRVGPPNSVTVKLLTKYIELKLHPRHVVLFEDPTESYSQSLAQAFAAQYTADGYANLLAPTMTFKTGGPAATLSQSILDVLHQSQVPDVIVFTSNNVNDMTTVLNTIPDTPQYAQLKVAMGIAGYEVTESDKHFNGYNRLIFASAAFPDEWNLFSPGNQPLFFQEYANAYDPQGKHHGAYYFTRPNSFIMLGYDAMLVLLKGSQIALQAGKTSLTPDQLRQALATINLSQPLMGISGEIALGSDGNPIDKITFVLSVDSHTFTHMSADQGCFVITRSCDPNKIQFL